MAELLTLFACINNTGCSATSGQYYNTHPMFQEFVKDETNHIKQAVGPIVTEYWAPVLWAAAGKEGTIRLTKSFSLGFKIDNQVLMFKRDF